MRRPGRLIGRIDAGYGKSEAAERAFVAADVHREALAALILFVEAAKREEVTVAMTEKIARYLRDARADPALRFAEEEVS